MSANVDRHADDPVVALEIRPVDAVRQAAHRPGEHVDGVPEQQERRHRPGEGHLGTEPARDGEPGGDGADHGERDDGPDPEPLQAGELLDRRPEAVAPVGARQAHLDRSERVHRYRPQLGGEVGTDAVEGHEADGQEDPDDDGVELEVDEAGDRRDLHAAGVAQELPGLAPRHQAAAPERDHPPRGRAGRRP